MPEKRICKITGREFEIREREIEFLKKITPVFNGVKYPFPLPEFCPDERLRLRTLHRNEQYMYRTRSAMDDKPLVSVFSPDKPYKIYPQSYWFSDNWDPLGYGRDYDFNQTFFKQFHELSKDVPHANMVVMNNENSEYTTGTGFCKNCYLINSSEYCEDCYYGKLLQDCKNAVDTSYAYDSELLYECFDVRNCYNCEYVYNSQNSSDCRFCDNITGCRNCFLCVNLNGKEYYFMNKGLSKAEYELKIKEFHGYSGVQKALKIFDELRAKRIHKYGNILNSENCSGDFIRDSRNCIDCYDVNDSQDCMYVHVGVKCNDLLDCSNMYIKPELSYQTMGVIETFNVHFCIYVFYSSDLLYCENCYSCKYCFGCSGLRNKNYCVFNKQYTKAEYEALVPKIIEYMQKGNEWGKFFPEWISPFAYNETLANDYLPLTKKEALLKSYRWKDDIDQTPEVEKTIQAERLPDKIEDIPDDILNWAIVCEKSKRPYKLIPQELKFYRAHGIPVPHRHPDVRHKDRMALRNPRKLYDRKCAKCNTDIQTTYSPDRPETVYCEQCYLKEVY